MSCVNCGKKQSCLIILLLTGQYIGIFNHSCRLSTGSDISVDKDSDKVSDMCILKVTETSENRKYNTQFLGSRDIRKRMTTTAAGMNQSNMQKVLFGKLLL